MLCQEMYRVLAPGGCALIVSYGTPDTRLPFLQDRSLSWEVKNTFVPGAANTQVYICTKIDKAHGDALLNTADREDVLPLPLDTEA
jgi:hypothetical protein